MSLYAQGVTNASVDIDSIDRYVGIADPYEPVEVGDAFTLVGGFHNVGVPEGVDVARTGVEEAVGDIVEVGVLVADNVEVVIGAGVVAGDTVRVGYGVVVDVPF